jgi:BolA family transcriptional regulator, general stress-responsive regulator
MKQGVNMAARLRGKLETALSPTSLLVEDESAKHAGHAGAREGGETHFRVRIVSQSFAGLSRVERQRKVYAAVAEELAERVHALSLITLTPEEAKLG